MCVPLFRMTHPTLVRTRGISRRYASLPRPQESLTMPPMSPPMGGASLPPTTKVDEVADWIQSRDKLPLLLALSLYTTPIVSYGDFVLQPEFSQSNRCQAWLREQTEEWIVGCRGTDVFSSTGTLDLKDDKKIAFGSYCDLSLVAEASDIIQRIIDEGYDYEDIIIVGHSLGGSAALCVSTQYKIRCISLNGGASPTNPVMAGPGPMLATHYHIFGDLISTHVSPTAARVIRVKGEKTEFGTFYPHAAVRILKSDGLKTPVSADEEDQAYLKWASTYSLGWKLFSPLFSLASYLAYLKSSKIAKKSPIPGSQRWEMMAINSQLQG